MGYGMYVPESPLPNQSLVLSGFTCLGNKMLCYLQIYIFNALCDSITEPKAVMLTSNYL